MPRLGIDLVSVEALARMVEVSGASFLASSWTEQERRYCANRAERLAGLWAAKEATMKALGIGIGDLTPLDVEVRNVVGRGATLVLWRGAAAQSDRLGVQRWSVSISQGGGWAIAIVIGTERLNELPES
jgi:holo-[acyl-carrier protein] synthase